MPWNSVCLLIPLETGCRLNRHFDGESSKPSFSSALVQYMKAEAEIDTQPDQLSTSRTGCAVSI